MKNIAFVTWMLGCLVIERIDAILSRIYPYHTPPLSEDEGLTAFVILIIFYLGIGYLVYENPRPRIEEDEEEEETKEEGDDK